MDVFKYLKKADSLLREAAADDAREMGLEYAGYGKWKDPKTGQITHKSIKSGGQTQLQQLDTPEQPQGQQSQQQDPKTLSDFRKDAPKPEQQAASSVGDQMGRVIPGGPTINSIASGNVDAVVTQMARGRYDAMSSNRKADVKQQAKDIIAQLNAERQAEVDAQVAAEVEGEIEAQANAEAQDKEDQNQEEIDSLLDSVGLGEDTPERIEYLSQQEQPELTEVQMQNEDERRQAIIDSLDLMMTQPEKKKGAGANKLSREDAELLKTYIEGNGPKIERMEISDEDMAFAKDYLKKNHKGAFTKLALGTKGAPKERYEGRGDAVLRSYLANRGLSAVTGKPLSYFASELDHITSLGNGGVDGFENWAWVDKRYNQFMSALDDEGVLKKIEKLLNANPDDERLKELKGELTNEVRNRYGTYFRQNGTAGVSLEDIEDASGIGGEQMLKALASAAGVNTYKGSEDRTRARGRFIGYPNLKQALIEKLNPATREEMDEFDESLNEIRDFIEEKNKEMEPFTKRGRKKAAKTKMEEAYDHWYELQKPGRMVFERLRRSLHDPLS